MILLTRITGERYTNYASPEAKRSKEFITTRLIALPVKILLYLN
jgi:hypothetical protein